MKRRPWHQRPAQATDPWATAPRPPRRRLRRHLRLIIVVALLFVGFEGTVLFWSGLGSPTDLGSGPLKPPATPRLNAGDVIAVDAIESFDAPRTAALIRHNYPAGVNAQATPITKIMFHYRSQLPNNDFVTVYGRAYLPADTRTGLPVFAFAPGTTGIGDQCAASLEQPARGNWGGYDAHMAAYAVQGYAAVTTDYEGQRDPTRLHHYMIGELEGRALLDAVRALHHLPQAGSRLAPNEVFVAGYSQGGHAAFWADKIADRYAPEVRPIGVVGFGPVMSVEQTLTDITHGANINWFGPNVLVSYQDYYHTTYPGILMPRRTPNLTAEVSAHCIDSDLPYWGHTPNGLYTPEFIAAAGASTLGDNFSAFAKALAANAVGPVPTKSAKRINHGALDNVVLPAQSTNVLPELCAASTGSVQLQPYPHATHYDTMLQSFNDTVGWMRAVAAHQDPPSTCP